jgi:hypothetical protein
MPAHMADTTIENDMLLPIMMYGYEPPCLAYRIPEQCCEAASN